MIKTFLIAALIGAIAGRLVFRYGVESEALTLFVAAMIVIGVSRLTGWPRFRQ